MQIAMRIGSFLCLTACQIISDDGFRLRYLVRGFVAVVVAAFAVVADAAVAFVVHAVAVVVLAVVADVAPAFVVGVAVVVVYHHPCFAVDLHVEVAVAADEQVHDSVAVVQPVA